MNKYIKVLFSMVLIMAVGEPGSAQLTVDIGKDTVYCAGLYPDTMYIRDCITIENGVEPYTYAWECTSRLTHTTVFTASDYLSDTTIPNPYFKTSPSGYDVEWLKFYLRVTDSEGAYGMDSINIGFSGCICPLGYDVIEIHKGDSILLDAGGPYGKFVKFYWVPAYGLTDPDSSATWCKPEVSTSYSIARIDSFGCNCTCHRYDIWVLPASADERDLDGFHTRAGVWGNPPEQYKFRDTPEDAGFLTEFPWEAIHEEVNEADLDSIDIDYWIHTSVSDAEMAMVERLDMSSLFMRNIIDDPLPDGMIGDNCWHEIELTGYLTFVRNNVLVIIQRKENSRLDPKIIERTARKIDSVIVNSETVSESTQIPGPVIMAITIISSPPRNMEDVVDIKIDAVDIDGKKLYYRKYATGFAIVSETGILKISFNENTDVTDDTTRARVKIWVWNEDHIVSSAEEEIPFSITSAYHRQGPAAENTEEVLCLKQNYPNPFSASTVISYALTESLETNVKIYDLTGREIITIANGPQPAGTYQLIWDGKDNRGLSVPPGIYFCCLESGSTVRIKKMTLLH